MTEDEEYELYEALLNDPDRRMIAPAEGHAIGVQFPYGGKWCEVKIWEGYFNASLILLRKILKYGPNYNSLIFPALFNLRHAIEVALKWHIRYAGGTVPKGAGHNLKMLVDAFRRTADGFDEETTYISDSIMDCISELDVVDPRSITFRYSTELDGSHIETTEEHWDICRLYFTVDHLTIYFDGLSGRINLSQDEDYQAYLRS